jgi:EAL domain-containing protein (putative c-di-GMP-specific phosphodiesterase class I)/DNA-binding SARP family transcriptional activator
MLGRVGAPSIRISLLGGLTIARDDTTGRPPSLPGRRSELVFAYLVAERRRTVSRDELADALWPELLPDSWAAALRGVVSEVRRVLESAGLVPDDVLITERSGYRLALPDGVAVDLDEARDALAGARVRLDAGDGALAATLAGRAEALAGLPFLPHHDGPWVDGIRDELAALHLAALELQVRARSLAGDPRAAAEVAERLVRAEPFSEVAHRLWIGALGEAGDRVGALHAYEHCRATLDSELGVSPSAETDAVLRLALGPADEPAPPRTPATAAATGATELAGLSVLVVEDHDFQRRTALALLRGLGVATVDQAPDGQAALELLAASTPPDIIICDIDMPGMDGVEFIRRVAERGMASAVAIASALDARLVRAVGAVCEGYGLQVLGAVEKPLTARRLSELLAAYRRPAPPGAHAPRPPVSPGQLAEALASGAVVADFEPIVDLARGDVSGAQVVPRRDGDSQPLSSRVLVEALEARDLAAAFTDRMLELACAQLGELDRAGVAIELWIELPGAALGDPAIADRLAELVRERDGDPRRIVCAVDARALRGDPRATLGALTRLRVKGFGLCLDDFGPGQPASDELQRYPLTAVRLGAELVTGAASDPARTSDLQEAIDLAATQDLAVVGRGCASAAEFELLLALGCGHGEGAFIAGPLPASELAAWALRWSPPPLHEEGPP